MNVSELEFKGTIKMNTCHIKIYPPPYQESIKLLFYLQDGFLINQKHHRGNYYILQKGF